MNIVCFGDSVTEAHRNKEDLNDLGRGYTLMIQKKFKQTNFFNRGISGERIKDLIQRVDQDVIDLKPDLVFIWIGVNDAWLPYLLNQSFSYTSFESDFDFLLQRLKDIKVVLVKPFVFKIGQVDDLIFKDVQFYRDKIDVIAEKHNLDVIDIEAKMLSKVDDKKPKQLLSDGIHPTKAGYEVIHEVIGDYLEAHYENL